MSFLNSHSQATVTQTTVQLLGCTHLPGLLLAHYRGLPSGGRDTTAPMSPIYLRNHQSLQVLTVLLLAAQVYAAERTGLPRVDWTVPQDVCTRICLRIHDLLSTESPQGMFDCVHPSKCRNYSWLLKQMVSNLSSLKNVSAESRLAYLRWIYSTIAREAPF